MTALLDLSGIMDEETFHEYVSKRLNFPGYYGFNLDALWDCLNDYAISNPTAIIRLEGISDFSRLNPTFAPKVLQCFSDLSDKDKGLRIEYYDDSPSGEGLTHE